MAKIFGQMTANDFYCNEEYYEMSYETERGYLYRNYETYYYYLVDRTVSHELGEAFELIITLDDGSKWAYYDPDRSLRPLPKIDISRQQKDIEKELTIDFGIRLGRLMRYRSVSQGEMASLLGVSQSQISRYVKGLSFPTISRLYLMAEILECSVDYLLYKK
jgi:predicted XRE-type DNA-binding protein